MSAPELTKYQLIGFELRYGFERAAEAVNAFRLAWEESVKRDLQRLNAARIADRKRANRDEALYQRWRAEKEKGE